MKGGRVASKLVNVIPVKNEGGEIVCVLERDTDITEREHIKNFRKSGILSWGKRNPDDLARQTFHPLFAGVKGLVLKRLESRILNFCRQRSHIRGDVAFGQKHL